MITLSMNESEAKTLLVVLNYATRHENEIFGSTKESLMEVRTIVARLETTLGDLETAKQPLQNKDT